MKPFDREIVSGSVLRSVWKLSWPLVLLNLVNGMQGFVNHIMVGHYVHSANSAANAAIGVSWQVFMVVVVFVSSIFHGTNVLVARYAGRQDRAALSEVFYSSFLCAVAFLVCVVAPLGWWLAPHLLNFVGAKEDVQVHALPYLRILFVLGAPLFLMFMVTGAFNASGDPRTPLKLGILTTVLNISVSMVLIPGLGPVPSLGTTGAALGSVISPFVSVAIALSLVLRRKMIIQPPRRWRLMPDFGIMATVVRIGLPTGIQGVLLNIGGVCLLRFIGLLENSSAAQAAYTICYAQLFALVTWTSFGLRAASSTLMGQNIGAGDPQRGKHSVRLAAWIGSSWAVVVGFLFWAGADAFLGVFNLVGEPAHGYAVSLLHYLSFSGVFLAGALALTGGMQGAGETKTPMYIAFVTQIVILLSICEAFYLADALTPERIWMAILVSHASRLIMTWAVFRTDGWIHKVIELVPPAPLEEETRGA